MHMQVSEHMSADNAMAIHHDGRPLAIEARGLVKSFDGTRAVDGVDLSVPEGAIYGVLGPNGAGKTTTLRMLLGIIDPDKGVRRVFGHDRPHEIARLVGYLGLSPDTVFTAEVQDRLADVLLVEAGFNAFVNGELSRAAFMNNLAKIWAGLPTSSGKSYYDGYAGNRHTISRAYFERQMAAFFPSLS